MVEITSIEKYINAIMKMKREMKKKASLIHTNGFSEVRKIYHGRLFRMRFEIVD